MTTGAPDAKNSMESPDGFAHSTPEITCQVSTTLQCKALSTARNGVLQDAYIHTIQAQARLIVTAALRDAKASFESVPQPFTRSVNKAVNRTVTSAPRMRTSGMCGYHERLHCLSALHEQRGDSASQQSTVVHIIAV